MSDEAGPPSEPCEPPEPYGREQELAILRAAVADMCAGRGVPFEEFMAELAAKLNLPPVSTE